MEKKSIIKQPGFINFTFGSDLKSFPVQCKSCTKKEWCMFASKKVTLLGVPTFVIGCNEYEFELPWQYMYFLFHVSTLTQKRGLRYWNNLMTLNAQDWKDYVLSDRYDEDLHAFNILRLNVGRSEIVNKSFFNQQ